MSLLDLIIISILVFCTLISAAWGFIRQVIAVGGLLIGIWLAGTFDTTVAGSLGFITDPKLAKGVAFVIIVLVVSAIASIIASVLYFMAGLLFLGLFDHLLGAFLGFIQGVLFVGIFLVATLTIWPDWTKQQLAQSTIADKVVDPLTSVTLVLAPQDLKDFIQHLHQQI